MILPQLKKGMGMDRYKIALADEYLPERRLFHFPPTRTVGRTVKYIKHCIMKEGIFIADNIPEDALNGALIEISKLYNAPILVKTPKMAQLFAISYSYRQIFGQENLPKGRFFVLYDCFEEDLDRSIEPIIAVYTSKKVTHRFLTSE